MIPIDRYPGRRCVAHGGSRLCPVTDGTPLLQFVAQASARKLSTDQLRHGALIARLRLRRLLLGVELSWLGAAARVDVRNDTPADKLLSLDAETELEFLPVPLACVEERARPGGNLSGQPGLHQGLLQQDLFLRWLDHRHAGHGLN